MLKSLFWENIIAKFPADKPAVSNNCTCTYSPLEMKEICRQPDIATYPCFVSMKKKTGYLYTCISASAISVATISQPCESMSDTSEKVSRIRESLPKGLAKVSRVRESMPKGLVKVSPLRESVPKGLAKVSPVRESMPKGLTKVSRMRESFSGSSGQLTTGSNNSKTNN